MASKNLVKSFEFAIVGDERTSVINAFSIDQAKRLMREALGVTRLPRGTTIVSVEPTNAYPDEDLNVLIQDRADHKKAPSANPRAKKVSNKHTYFICKFKDGNEVIIVETALVRAKEILREKLGVTRLPSGMTFDKIEEMIDQPELLAA